MDGCTWKLHILTSKFRRLCFRWLDLPDSSFSMIPGRPSCSQKKKKSLENGIHETKRMIKTVNFSSEGLGQGWVILPQNSEGPWGRENLGCRRISANEIFLSLPWLPDIPWWESNTFCAVQWRALRKLSKLEVFFAASPDLEPKHKASLVAAILVPLIAYGRKVRAKF